MQLLHDRYDVRGLLVGYDHRFGHDRTEGFADYVRHGQALDIEVLQAKPCYEAQGRAVSSSLIRRLLKEGQLQEANACLGRWYTLSGRVVHGHQVGRSLGFPTANIQLDEPDKLVPADGVYATLVEVQGKRYGGMLSIGKRPTIDNGSDRSIEVHVLGFEGNLYGQALSLHLLERTRQELKFASREELMNQLSKDRRQIEEIVKEYLS